MANVNLYFSIGLTIIAFANTDNSWDRTFCLALVS